MPNLHFWSSGIGKDTIMFFAIILFIYSLTNKKKRVLNLVLSVLLMFFVRQHMLLFLVLGFGFGYLLSSKAALYKKVSIGVIALIIVIPLLTSLLKLTEIESLNSSDIEEFSTSKAGSFSEDSGSGIDISSYFLPLKVLTFLFRPLFFDAPNAFGLIISLENAFYLVLTLSYNIALFRVNEYFLQWDNNLVILTRVMSLTIIPILGIGVIGNLFTIIYEQKQGLYASIASVVITLFVNLVVGASKNMLFVGLGYFLCNFLSFFVFYFWIKIIINNQLKFKNDY